MVFNATFNNSSVISWRSVLLVEETGVYPEKPTDPSEVTDKLYHIMLSSAMNGVRTLYFLQRSIFFLDKENCPLLCIHQIAPVVCRLLTFHI